MLRGQSGQVAEDVEATPGDQLGGRPVELTSSEFEVLAALARANGRTLSRDALLEAIHPQDCDSFDRAVDNIVARMRKKLPEGMIRTVRSRGYQLAVPVRRTTITWPPVAAAAGRSGGRPQ